MKIVVASQSQVKLDAVRDALLGLGITAEIVGVKTKSGVAEQPIDDETLQGARNRVRHAQKLVLNADLYIAIENGIFHEDGKFIDKAVVLTISKEGKENLALSEGVEFPAASVEKARQRGFATTSVGQIMAEDNIVTQHDDPHLSLVGKSRAVILTETITELLAVRLKWAQIARSDDSERFL